MEEENKKARKAERKEYNDTVRELVAFIRKRVGVWVIERGQIKTSTHPGHGIVIVLRANPILQDKRVVKFQAEEAAKRAARQVCS